MVAKLKPRMYIIFIFIFHSVYKYLPTNAMRIFLLRIIGARIGKNNYISRNVKFDFPWRVNLGNNNYISNSVYLDCRGGAIFVGNSCDISSNASIYTLSHNIYSSDFKIKKENIYIGNRVWLCVNVVLLPGSRIDDGSVVGANSVVSKKLKSYSLYQGNPVKFFKKLPITRASKVRIN